MSGLSWFRMYAEAIDDDKLRLLAFEDRWHFVALLCLKTQGVLDERDEQLKRRRMAIKMGLDLPELESVMHRLETVGLVSSKWQPLAWKKRQFVSDSSTKRVRAFRERSRNVTETPSEQSRDRAETEQNKADSPPGLDPAAWSRWCDYRKQIRKPLKPVSIPAAQRELAAFGSDQSAVVEQSVAQGWQGLFALKARPKAAETIGGRRWE